MSRASDAYKAGAMEAAKRAAKSFLTSLPENCHLAKQRQAGIPMKNVAEMLGTASIATTDRFYAHVTPVGQKEAARKLAKAQANGRQ